MKYNDQTSAVVTADVFLRKTLIITTNFKYLLIYLNRCNIIKEAILNIVMFRNREFILENDQ